MIRFFLKVVIYQVRKFWNRGATIRSVEGSLFVCFFPLIFLPVIFCLFTGYKMGVVFEICSLTWSLLVLVWASLTIANMMFLKPREIQIIVEGSDPGEFSDERDWLYLQKIQSLSRFPYRRLPVVALRTVVFMTRRDLKVLFNFFSMIFSGFAKTWKGLVEEVN